MLLNGAHQYQDHLKSKLHRKNMNNKREGDDPTQSLGAQTRKPGAQKVIEESQGLNKLVKKADVDDNFAF